jgi:hypothetical protein
MARLPRLTSLVNSSSLRSPSQVSPVFTRRLTKQCSGYLIFGYAEMPDYFGEDSIEHTYFDRIVVRDSNMRLTILFGRDFYMAIILANYLVNITFE